MTVETKLETLNNFVIIEWVSKEASVGAIVVENTKQLSRPVKSKIIAVPSNNDQGLKVGEEILFYRHACEKLMIDNVDTLVLPLKAIIGVYR